MARNQTANSNPIGSHNGTNTPWLKKFSKLMRNTTASIVSRLDFANRAALTFGGQRSLDTALGRTDIITPDNYFYRFRRGGISNTLVSKLPKDVWRLNTKLIEDEDSETETSWEIAANKVFNDLMLWSILKEADIASRQGRYGVIVLTVDDGLDPREPLTPLSNPQQLLKLTPYSETEAEFTDTEINTNNPRFGLPDSYRLKLETGQSLEIHHSRVIHIVSGQKLYHAPVLEMSWNDLDDLEKVIGGASETAFQARGTLWTTAPDTIFNANDLEQIHGQAQDGEPQPPLDTMEETVGAFRHAAIADIVIEGISAKQLGGTVPDIEAVVDMLIQLISGTQSYPRRALLGTEEGRLAGGQDSDQYEDTKRTHWEDVGIKYTRQLVDKLIELRVIPPVESYKIERPNIDKTSPEALAGIVGTYAKANKDQRDAGQDVILTSNEIRKVLSMGELDESESGHEDDSDDNNSGHEDDEESED